MSSFNLANKLKPARKAWKSFTVHLKSNFHNFHISETIKSTKKQFMSLLLTIRSLIPRKIFDITTRSRRRCRYHLNYPHRCQPPHIKRFETVYIDELLPGNNNSFQQPNNAANETSTVASSSSSTSTTKNDVLEKDKFLGNKIGDTSEPIVHDGDGMKLSLSSRFPGIDVRAEEFIFRFKEDMKLEKEKSVIDYQEMLARSV